MGFGFCLGGLSFFGGVVGFCWYWFDGFCGSLTHVNGAFSRFWDIHKETETNQLDTGIPKTSYRFYQRKQFLSTGFCFYNKWSLPFL